MKKVTLSLIISILVAMVSPNVSAQSVSWRYVGRPVSARKIAIRFDGFIYALNNDGSLWVNRNQGNDKHWVYLYHLPRDINTITCGSRSLFFQKTNRELWRVARADVKGPPNLVGTPGAATEIAGTEDNALNFPFLWALNVDKTLWFNTSGGADGKWQKVGRPHAAIKIAAARGVVFALNTDGSFWINRHGGSDRTWKRLGLVKNAIEITAASIGQGNRIVVYRLDRDQSLWEGTIQQ